MRGPPPYGFARGADGLEPEPYEQAAIARAHVLRDAGESVLGVVLALAELGYVGRTGRPLTRCAVSTMLRRLDCGAQGARGGVRVKDAAARGGS
jgi:hypothetical protein